MEAEKIQEKSALAGRRRRIFLGPLHERAGRKVPITAGRGKRKQPLAPGIQNWEAAVRYAVMPFTGKRSAELPLRRELPLPLPAERLWLKPVRLAE